MTDSKNGDMRLIGQLDNRILAERAGFVLGAHGIPNRVESEEGRHWSVWVHGEEDLERARQLLGAFLASPEDPRFHAAVPPTGAGSGKPKSGEPASSEGGRPAAERDPHGGVPGVVSVLLLVLCVYVAAITRLGTESAALSPLMISRVPRLAPEHWRLMLPEIRRGEVWRLVSPVLLHFSLPHLLFNLWTFWGLASAIERVRGSVSLLAMVVGFGIVSNLGQYLHSGPQFGGMSGVIYGLLGYVWMMGRYRSSAGLALHPQIVLLMLVWFVICLYGAMPGSAVGRTLGVSVANTAHGMGLLAGVVWGRWAAWRLR